MASGPNQNFGNLGLGQPINPLLSFNNPGPASNPPWRSSPNRDFPTIPNTFTGPLVSVTDGAHVGLALDGQSRHIPGGYVGVNNDNVGARLGYIPHSNDGKKVFGEVAGSVTDTTRLYGGAQSSFDSKGLADTGAWLGVSKDFNKDLTAGVQVERSLSRDNFPQNGQPDTNVKFWALFKF
ncbi:hypothetical protein Trco_007240 [Trichoderma cornu-damae]|uniref:Uncharacterized protein n=1 Tax=Trichoderma cornu-damae TaxID=654480 RepID=A0A9P8QFS6_9HYPO|nr:hypothetical protein Trco_007240 [Trichoderma cornu-damae]